MSRASCPYTAFDRLVAWFRFRAALPHIRERTSVCDVGCGLDARFLGWLGPRIRSGLGIDRKVGAPSAGTLAVVADITDGLPVRSAQFDHVVMLAVLEHLTIPDHVLREAHRVLVPGGSLIMTWPNPIVDVVLAPLHRVGIVSNEMESDQHTERIPLPRLQAMLRSLGFCDLVHRRFEFGLNNLVVATKPRHEEAGR